MIYWTLLGAVVIFLLLERKVHRERLRKIPIRIHVNGTRGKTSVTRLTAELLRRAGIRTLAKTTGDHPEMILPDGTRRAIRRRGPARIHEQMALVAEAARHNAQAMVVECMAIDPHLQQVCEQEMLRATIAVITNVRPDHFEAMGKSLDEMALALSRTIPQKGTLITSQGPHAPFFRNRSEALGTGFRLAENHPGGADQDAVIPGLGENLALVREIAMQLNLAPSLTDEILRDMTMRERREPYRETHIDALSVRLIDAFSANDTRSAARFQEICLPAASADGPRADRPFRSKAFSRFIADQTCYDAVAIVGDGRYLARRVLRSTLPATKPLCLAETEPRQLLMDLAQLVACASYTIVGLGNHRGAGEALRRFFTEETPCC
jgi:poly-gamma-glutamate synthase PgsB/CapB